VNSRRLPPKAPHVVQDHELRRCYDLAKRLAEALDVADLPGLHHQAVDIRERVFGQINQLAESRKAG
jgi:hypothetical protein